MYQYKSSIRSAWKKHEIVRNLTQYSNELEALPGSVEVPTLDSLNCDIPSVPRSAVPVMMPGFIYEDAGEQNDGDNLNAGLAEVASSKKAKRPSSSTLGNAEEQSDEENDSAGLDQVASSKKAKCSSSCKSKKAKRSSSR